MSLSLQKLNKKRVAIIGSGISGLSSAWLLRNTADITLFEADNRFGGHANTHLLKGVTPTLSIDTGFMVFNRPNYPLLTKFFDELGVQSYPTDMSFSVCLDNGELEYAGNNLNSLFAQRRNLVKPTFLKMLRDILKFNASVKKLINQPNLADLSVKQFLDQHSLGLRFQNDYLYPMAGAIWSCPPQKIADFPAISFAKFFQNHGLINLIDRPEWHTVRGGSNSYVDKVINDLGSSAKKSCKIESVVRREESIEILLKDNILETFDEVIFACHTDQVLKIFQNPSQEEISMLQTIPYQENRAILHRDERVMPNLKKVWSSWNYSGSRKSINDSKISVTYWMNSLQELETETNYFVSLNPINEPDTALVEAEYSYHHPTFNSASFCLEDSLNRVQGKNRVWFSGAWTGYGFHEDGIRSGVRIAKALGADITWQTQLEKSLALHKTNSSEVEVAA
tara:strand:- start:4724 stop:6079 length:1356 start_codon:yes stop_codon:yes gene_type:complete